MTPYGPGRSSVTGRAVLLAAFLAAASLAAVGATSSDAGLNAHGTVGGQGHAAGPPPGHTGGLGEPTCLVCHTEFPLNLDGTLLIEGLPTTYDPGASYPLTLVLRSEGMERAGFQGAFRRADGSMAGSLAPVEGLVALQPSLTRPDLVYLQHAEGALETRGSALASWSFTWTAPSSSSEPVYAHFAANSGNDDNSPLGDIVYTYAVTLQPTKSVTNPSGRGAR